VKLLVVDSSTAIKWFTIEPGSSKALRLLEQGYRLGAPDLVIAETANALRRKERMNALAATAVVEAVSGMARLFDELVPSKALVADAIAMSQSLDHSVYDCLYVAACRNLGAPLITSDGRFVRKLARTPYAKHVIRLDDWKG
jgi:hypothetical protein